jgi:hypothetical protein
MPPAAAHSKKNGTQKDAVSTKAASLRLPVAYLAKALRRRATVPTTPRPSNIRA